MDAGPFYGINPALVSIRRRSRGGGLQLRYYIRGPEQLTMEIARYRCPLLVLSFLCYEAMLIACYGRGRRDGEVGLDCPNISMLVARTRKRKVLRRSEEDVIHKISSIRKRGLQPIKIATSYTRIDVHDKLTPHWMQVRIHELCT